MSWHRGTRTYGAFWAAHLSGPIMLLQVRICLPARTASQQGIARAAENAASTPLWKIEFDTMAKWVVADRAGYQYSHPPVPPASVTLALDAQRAPYMGTAPRGASRSRGVEIRG